MRERYIENWVLAGVAGVFTLAFLPALYTARLDVRNATQVERLVQTKAEIEAYYNNHEQYPPVLVSNTKDSCADISAVMTNNEFEITYCVDSTNNQGVSGYHIDTPLIGGADTLASSEYDDTYIINSAKSYYLRVCGGTSSACKH